MPSAAGHEHQTVLATQREPGAGPVPSVPPGIDVPADGPLSKVLAPRWRALVVAVSCCVVVAVVLLLVLPTPRGRNGHVVDPAPTIARAAQLPGFPVYAPAGLAAGWHPNSAHLDVTSTTAHLHVGYLGPDLGYDGLEESTTKKLRLYVDQMSADGKPRGLVSLHGVVWVHLVSERKSIQQSLVWYGPKTCIVVTGTSSLTDLEQLAGSLPLPAVAS